MNGDQPVTHAQLQSELQALEARMNERHDMLRSDMQQANSMLRSEMQHMYDDLKETIRDSQTEVLKAFYGFTEGMQLRFKEADATEASLKERLTSIETRLMNVEMRLNMPPALRPPPRGSEHRRHQ